MRVWARDEFERYKGEKDERKIKYLLDVGRKEFEKGTGMIMGTGRR